MPDDKAADRSDEMEDKLSELGEHIDDAEKKLAARKGDAEHPGGDGGAIAGDWKGEQDHGGNDPVGAAQDAQEGTDEGTPAKQSDDPDELVEEEAASPT